MVYLDHAASTPPDPRVLETLMQLLAEVPANPAAAHRMGTEAATILEAGKRQIAGLLGVKPSEIIYTSGGTESNQLAIIGTISAYSTRGNQVITTALEHPSVFELLHDLRRRSEVTGNPLEVIVVPVTNEGIVDLEALERALTERTILVSIAHIHSEIGVIQPLAQIGEIIRRRSQSLFHVDAAQSLCKLPLPIKTWGIDLLSTSAHKWHAPKGSGLLYCREGIRLQPQLIGGGQQGGLRAGTEQPAAIAAMAKALRLYDVNSQTTEANRRVERLYALRRKWQQRLRSCPGVTLTGPLDETYLAPHIVHFRIPGYRAEVVVRALSEEGFFVSSQSACSSRSSAPSRVLLALGLSEQEARSGIRVSYGEDLNPEHIDTFAETLERILHRTVYAKVGGTDR